MSSGVASFRRADLHGGGGQKMFLMQNGKQFLATNFFDRIPAVAMLFLILCKVKVEICC